MSTPQIQPETEQEDPFGLPPIGDNVPPPAELPTVEEIITHLEREYANVLQRSKDIVVKAAEFMVITTDEQDAAATEFMVKVRSNYKAAEAGRVKEKDPYYTRDAAIHAWFKTNILDPIGLAPASAKERFDPVERDDLGVGPRVNMAQTLFKTAKMEAERKVREEEARKLREQEAAAARARLAAAEAERKAREEAAAAAAAAARKRNADSIAAAEALAAAARKRQEEAEVLRVAALQAENKAAADRAAAEAAASAKAADITRSRGGRGGVSSLREYLAVRDIRRDELGKGENPGILALLPYIDDKALEKAANAYADANKATVESHIKNETQPIRGMVFYIDHRSSGRA